VLAGLVVLGAWAAVTGVQLYQRALSLQSHLHYVQELAQHGTSDLGLADLEVAGQHLSGMRQDLEAIQALASPFLPFGKLLLWIPGHGGDLAAASDLLEIATGTAAAGDGVFTALSPALELLNTSQDVTETRKSIGERLLPVLVAAQPDLQSAAQDLDRVAKARERIDTQALSPPVAGLLTGLDRYLPWLEMAVNGVMLAPGLLGAEGPRTYLILAQNNHELRATGGFISGVGVLRIESGQLTSLSFEDSYAVDNLGVPHDTPPPDLQRTLYGDLWLFRDSNWNADFPTSAQRALDVYARDRGVWADGVIALDLTALRLLLDALGPIQIEGIADPVTSDNTLRILQTQWANPSSGPSFKEGGDRQWWLHRKDFMSKIANAVLDTLLTGQDAEPVRLAQAIKQALDEKHILIYLRSPQAADLLRNQNWDGALPCPASPSDVLLVVDSNVGFNKVDARIARSIRYQVDLSAEGRPHARLTVAYQHRSAQPVGDCIQGSRYGDTYADMMDRCYWDYVRVYVPAGSRLLVGPALPLPPGSLLARSNSASSSRAISPTLGEGGWAVWTAFFDLPTLEEKTLTFDYQLPVGVLYHDPAGLVHYRLRVQKQPGTEAVPLRVEITLPSDADLVEAVPADLPEMDTDLRTDRQFEVIFQPGLRKP